MLPGQSPVTTNPGVGDKPDNEMSGPCHKQEHLTRRTMKALLIALIAVSCLTSHAHSQSPYSEALARLDTKMLQKLEPDSQADQIRKDLVLQTIAIVSSQKIWIDPKAAVGLDNLYATASKDVAAEEKGSERLGLFPANRVRFIGRLISLAEPQPRPPIPAEIPIAVITQRTLNTLSKELQASMAGFCPCWPFCK